MIDCRACGQRLRDGAAFCTACGTSTLPDAPLPTPPTETGPLTWQPPRRPQPFPDSSGPGWPPPEPPRPNRGANRLLIGIATATAIVVIVGVALFVVRRPGGPEPVSPAAGPTASASVPAPRGTAPTSQAVTESDLLDQVAADSATAEGIVDYWVPQISSKRLGRTVNGTTYDHGAILADFRSLDARFPQSVLVSSNDYSSFRLRDFWVTLVASPLGSADAANGWCDSNGFAKEDCFAKRLSHTEGPDGNTKAR